MTPQFKMVKGFLKRFIEWADFTWGVLNGCGHGCKWKIDGEIVECYAESSAHGFLKDYYPNGFSYAYARKEKLDQPIKRKKSSIIFSDAMSDWMWRDENDEKGFDDEQVESIIDVMRIAEQHIFIILTKNPKLLLHYDWPKNVWTGFSSAPDYMNGQWLSDKQKWKYVEVGLRVMDQLQGRGNTTLMSIEPLSWDIAPLLDGAPLDMGIIGAASYRPSEREKLFLQPVENHVARTMQQLDAAGTAMFFKGNLDWPNHQWREDFPVSDNVPHPALINRQLNAIKYGWTLNNRLTSSESELKQLLVPTKDQMSLF